MFQTQLYWKENMLREGELCLDIDNELSIEDCVNIITTLFKLKIDDVNVAETDDSYNIDVYENLDNLLCFPDRLALFTYINKIEK